MTNPSRTVVALSILWAAFPILTLGWGAPFTFTYGAIRLRDRVLGWCAAGYGVLAAVSFYLAGNNNDNSWQSNAGAALALGTGVVASGQAFAIRHRLVGGRSHDDDPVVAQATEQLRLREKARQILMTNPGLAHELRIGRPDRSPCFDDGGLVDINHVPAEVMVRLGLDRSTAQEIVDVRDGIGGFSSADDLSVTLGLAPHVLDQVASRLVFIR